MAHPLRCHLLIGPPGSGKSTLAAVLREQLGGPEAVTLISTDALRSELHGDAAVQGDWPAIEALLHARLRAAITAGRAVILDATHARRPWRLAITQAIDLPAAVQWIGWWLQTPLEHCQRWNQQRFDPVPSGVLTQLHAALQQRHRRPERAEGFAAAVEINPADHPALDALVAQELGRLELRIATARSRDAALRLHGYSRLLDHERLLHLLQLLSRYPGLTASDQRTRQELEALVSPLPAGTMAERAAAFLSAVHGECYGDVEALEQDLAWLEAQGFLSATPVRTAITPPPARQTAEGMNGGWGPLADRPVFVRVMTLLRHFLQVPFDRRTGEPLAQHLIGQLEGIAGSYLPSETAVLRKDIERVLTPYGFRSRNANVRHGYGLGAAVLPPARLLEVYQVVEQAAQRLADPSAQDLLEELEERLRWAGLLPAADAVPLRVFANRSIVHPELLRPDALAVPVQAEKLEAAMLTNQRVVLQRFSASARHADSPAGELRVWPLQLVFHNIGWYLAFEEDAIGRAEGLIRTERLYRLGWRLAETGHTRPAAARCAAVKRLQRLMTICGGIYFGDQLDGQLAVLSDDPAQRRGWMRTVRFRCTPLVFSFLREGMQRFPLEQVRLSLPLPDDSWTPHALAPHVLAPLPGDRHPYPVEVVVPVWTAERDVDFRRWLFGYGDGVAHEQMGSEE
jgi:predicted kinase